MVLMVLGCEAYISFAIKSAGSSSSKAIWIKKKKDTAIRILKRKQIHTKPHNKEEKPFRINFSKAPRCYSIRKPPPGVINEVSALKMDPKQI